MHWLCHPRVEVIKILPPVQNLHRKAHCPSSQIIFLTIVSFTVVCPLMNRSFFAWVIKCKVNIILQREIFHSDSFLWFGLHGLVDHFIFWQWTLLIVGKGSYSLQQSVRSGLARMRICRERVQGAVWESKRRDRLSHPGSASAHCAIDMSFCKQQGGLDHGATQGHGSAEKLISSRSGLASSADMNRHNLQQTKIIFIRCRIHHGKCSLVTQWRGLHVYDEIGASRCNQKIANGHIVAW